MAGVELAVRNMGLVHCGLWVAEVNFFEWGYDGVALGTVSSVLGEGSFASAKVALEVVRADRTCWQVAQEVVESVSLPTFGSSQGQSHWPWGWYREALNLGQKARPIGALEEPRHLRPGTAVDARLAAQVRFVDLASQLTDRCCGGAAVVL